MSENEKVNEPEAERTQGAKRITPVRRSRPRLCKNCSHFIGKSEAGSTYLCWRNREYADSSGYTMKGEFCRELNEDFNCKSYKVKTTRIIAAYFA
jgi:hypothetical protein